MDPLENLRGLGLVPILTSEGLGWRGIKAERFRHSLREIEQPPFENHLIMLVLEPWRAERHQDGKVEKVAHAPGNVGLIPAGGPAARWVFEGEADGLQIILDPALVEGVAGEIGAEGAELLDFADARDPQIERLMLSLKAELEAGGALGCSAYLVNAFRASDEVEISRQDRDESQNNIRVDYSTAPTTPATPGAADRGTDAVGGAPERQQRLVGYLREGASSPWIVAAGLGLSALLGGLHALTPGHGKTLVAAYLIGNRGTVRHAAVLGGIVTLTHTASVIAVGLLALLAGRYVLPDVLVPALEVGAGLLVVALGLRLVRARWRKGAGHDHHGHGYHHHDDLDHHHHHHVPPADVRPGDLLAMGVSGGLVPCPEALGVMLVAIGLGQIGVGLALIVAFSLGLAAVLIAIGVLLVRCKSRLDRLGKPGSAWQRALPLVSAVVVTLLGAGIVLNGLIGYAT